MDQRERARQAEVQEKRERLRRWGWVCVALGLPGLGLIGYGAFLALWEGPSALVILGAFGALLALPAWQGARMIAKGWDGTDAEVASSGSGVVRATMGAVVMVALVGGLGVLSMPACGCSTRQQAYAAAIKSDLKNLTSQQEIYFSDNSTYSADMHSIGFVNSDGVEVRVYADTDGWSARAWHVALGVDAGCALWWADAPAVMATPGGATPPVAGQITCDELAPR